MGIKKINRKNFLIQHPICCFCGGGTKSEEPDHIPSRALFLNRHWPEGYLFPACVKCNRISRYDESIISFLSRLYPDPSTVEEKAEFNKIAESVNKYYPEIIKELTLSTVKKKRIAKKHNIATPVGGTSKDIPIVSLNGKRTNEAVLNFSRKIFMALFYKHTETILPKSGGIAVIWYTNMEVINGAIPPEINLFLNNKPALIRNSKNLDNQFNYKYKISECYTNAAFLINFRSSFFALGELKTNKEMFKENIHSLVMSTYDWNNE